MTIPKPYCASTRHAESDPKILFGYDLKCRWSLSDKKILPTDGRTDRDDSNIPQLSSESVGITKASCQSING